MWGTGGALRKCEKRAGPVATPDGEAGGTGPSWDRRVLQAVPGRLVRLRERGRGCALGDSIALVQVGAVQRAAVDNEILEPARALREFLAKDRRTAGLGCAAARVGPAGPADVLTDNLLGCRCCHRLRRIAACKGGTGGQRGGGDKDG